MSPIDKAIRNNIHLYRAIFSGRDIDYNVKNGAARSFQNVPPLYSNLVTTSPEWSPNEDFEHINKNFTHEGWPEWSVKDSFNMLDLTKNGFERLFSAKWLFLDKTLFQPCDTSGIEFEIVQDQNALSDWRDEWNMDEPEPLAESIFKDSLLDHSDIFFIAGYKDGSLSCGCFLNKSDDVVGISNFFANNGQITIWSDLASFVFRTIDCSAIVGYEDEKTVKNLKGMGVQSPGELTIWLRRSEFAPVI